MLNVVYARQIQFFIYININFIYIGLTGQWLGQQIVSIALKNKAIIVRQTINPTVFSQKQAWENSRDISRQHHVSPSEMMSTSQNHYTDIVGSWMYGISALLRTPFGEENSSGVSKCRLFSQRINAIFPGIIVCIVSRDTEHRTKRRL